MSNGQNIWSYSKNLHDSILTGYSDTVKLDDCVYGELASFYVLKSPCEGLSLQSVRFSDYGWIGDIRRNGLGKLLDSLKVTQGGKYLLPSRAPDGMPASYSGRYLGQLFRYADLGDGPLSDWLVERAVVRATPEANGWLRLFRHVRNCLAHGGFVCLPVEDGLGPVLVMEDADKTSYTARIVLRLETLLAWKRTIEAGPKSLAVTW